MSPTPRIDGFRGEFLWELDIAERQMIALAEAIPPGKYDWRPDEKARSVCEVFVHVAAGNFMLLDIVGTTAPSDLYAKFQRRVSPEGRSKVDSISSKQSRELAEYSSRSLATIETKRWEARHRYSP